MKDRCGIEMRFAVFIVIVLLTGCGWFPVAKCPPPDPPLVEEEAKVLDLTTSVEEPSFDDNLLTAREGVKAK